ncbi:hypothetical protein B0H17DRAFT_257264 [Mycena rosella]|uniref:Zn(2)-C6 fungal-type domain-containing protein n=1 Tax=Mycena rosella TaxID=1033263 RepID=A0AAD7CWB2_MYCRO|nr:hypothetical protein B0H17DRAFT_257264 [Mycena rosella]
MADYKISRPTTCKSCRERKIRCNGANPCGSCLRSRASLVCEYPPGRSNLPRSELPKGAACIPCRQRKRKCDGRRPCLPCRNKSRADACKYQQNKRGQHREPDSLLDEHFTTFEEIALMDASCSALVISDPERAVDMSVETTQDNISVHSIAEPSVNVALPPILHPTGISNLSVSCTSNPTDGDTAAELSSLRSLFLDNCWEYGLNLSPEKQKAIAHGDTSGAVVHPIFISISQLIGYLLASRPNSGRWAHFQGQTGGTGPSCSPDAGESHRGARPAHVRPGVQGPCAVLRIQKGFTRDAGVPWQCQQCGPPPRRPAGSGGFRRC